MAKKKKKNKKPTQRVEVVIPTKRDRYQGFIWIAFFTGFFFHLEIVLRYATVKGNLFPFLGYTFLFSCIYGIGAYLLTSLFSKPKYNRLARGIVIIGMVIVYVVNYLIYLQFKIFYDINTVTNGAMGVLTGFQRQIVHLIFNRPSLLRIGLCFLPVVLYVAFLRRYDKGQPLTKKVTIMALLAQFILFQGAKASVQGSPFATMAYDTHYSYQNAIDQFGLLTGIRLDAMHLLRKQNEVIVFSEPEEEIEEVQEEVIVYEPNVLDIDFKQLAEQSTGTLHELDLYVDGLNPSLKNEYTGLFKGKNLIFITAEAFSAEVIDQQRTPTLYRLATKGIQFLDYYQPSTSGTTGGEYENIFGLLPTKGGASMRITADYINPLTIGSLLDKDGYEGWAFHNNDYMFYNRHLTHNNLGYSHGYMGYGNGLEEYITRQWPESDLEMIQATFPMYVEAQPFNIYYMSVSGHNEYNIGGNAMSAKHWDKVKDLDYSDVVKGYLAANLELEDAMTELLRLLEENNILKDTVIVIAADHFPYGLDDDGALGELPYLSELYGTEVNDVLTRDHNRLILWCGSLEDQEPIIVDTPTSSLDILPTLCNLFDVAWDSRLLPGRDVFSNALPLMFDLNYNWKSDKGTYYAWTNRFVPKDDDSQVSEAYMERMNQIVRNKIRYCEGVLNTNYYAHVFSNE